MLEHRIFALFLAISLAFQLFSLDVEAAPSNDKKKKVPAEKSGPGWWSKFWSGLCHKSEKGSKKSQQTQKTEIKRPGAGNERRNNKPPRPPIESVVRTNSNEYYPTSDGLEAQRAASANSKQGKTNRRSVESTFTTSTNRYFRAERGEDSQWPESNGDGRSEVTRVDYPAQTQAPSMRSGSTGFGHGTRTSVAPTTLSSISEGGNSGVTKVIYPPAPSAISVSTTGSRIISAAGSTKKLSPISERSSRLTNPPG